GLDREVARGPDVRPAFREQQVDLGGPAADALDPDKLLDRFLVVSGQALEIELAGRYELAERARVTLLLARQAARAQRIEVGRQQGFGRNVRAEQLFELAPDARRRGDADLLADDRAQQRAVAALADSRLGITGASERCGNSRLARSDRVETRPELLCRQTHASSACQTGRQSRSSPAQQKGSRTPCPS